MRALCLFICLIALGCGNGEPPANQGVHTEEFDLGAKVGVTETWVRGYVGREFVKHTTAVRVELLFVNSGEYDVRVWGRGVAGQPDPLMFDRHYDVPKVKSDSFPLGGYADRIEVVYKPTPDVERRAAARFRYTGLLWGAPAQR